MRRRAPPDGAVAPPNGFLFQEALREEPFWLLVACSLVNLTTWAAAEDVFHWLRERHTTETLAAADPASLHDALRPLGLWRRRSAGLVRLANEWLRSPPACSKDVLKLPSCGKYAADSWAIFVEGRRDVTPRDGKLTWFMERHR